MSTLLIKVGITLVKQISKPLVKRIGEAAISYPGLNATFER
jgi:hypothetical protein